MLALGAAALAVASRWAGAVGLVRGNFFGDFSVDAQLLERYVGPYLAAHPDEADADHLEQLLFADRLAGSTIGEDKLSLADRIERDFQADDTVIADGWILSRTEVRIWAWMYELSG
jgi:hypothetical protein